MTELAELSPGLVPTGFSEKVLAKAADIQEPWVLWNDATTLAALAQKWNGHGKEKQEIKAGQMFVEIELGQRLGPNPGHGPGRGKKDSHDDVFEIPAYVVSDLRRYYDHRDLLVEAVREGKRSRRALLLAVDRAEAEKREIGNPEIRKGDFRKVLSDLDSESVTLVLTDPPYPTEYLPLWDDLAGFAARVLIPGGSLIAFSGQSILPEVLDRLRAHLRYWWTLALINGSGSQMIPGKNVSAGWKPLVWFVKDKRFNSAMLPDRINGSPPRKTVPIGDDGSWAQGVEELESIISGLTVPGDLIVDPFAGSGTTGLAALRFGRRFIGADLVA